MKHVSISKLSNVNIADVNKTELVDVSGMTFDYSLPHDKRIDVVLKTLENPYCFRMGDMGVKVEFSEEAPFLQDIFTNFLLRKKSGL